MTNGKSLEELRREVDAIDEALHDLLMRRADVTGAIAATKPRVEGRIPLARAMRPAREAEIMRRAVARHQGSLPVATVIRVIREILSASLAAQTPFRVHMFNHAAYTDLAHEHFGAGAALTPFTDVVRVVDRCAKDPDTLGVLPVPGATVAWWERLAQPGTDHLRVVAKLPFVAGEDVETEALVIAAIEQEATGDDTTMLIAKGVSAADLKDVGIAARATQSDLFEASEFVARDDPRLARFGGRVVTIGGYANPVRIKAKEMAQ